MILFKTYLSEERKREEDQSPAQNLDDCEKSRRLRLSERILKLQLDSKGSEGRSRICKTDGIGSMASSGSGGQQLGRLSYSSKQFPPVECVIVDAVDKASPAQRQVMDKELLKAELAMR